MKCEAGAEGMKCFLQAVRRRVTAPGTWHLLLLPACPLACLPACLHASTMCCCHYSRSSGSWPVPLA